MAEEVLERERGVRERVISYLLESWAAIADDGGDE